MGLAKLWRRKKPKVATTLTVEMLEKRVVLDVVPAYSSFPEAAAAIYLDFDGHFEASWGSYSNITTPPYDIDGVPDTFSETELANIEKVWRYVSDDFAPFQINVTTEEPPSFANGVALRVAIGGDSAWTGGTYGGYAYIGAFTSSVPNTAYVFPKHLGNGNPRYVGDAVSHESGHSFGLQHQSQWSGTTKVAEYQTGPGDGTAPLMGKSYSATRSLWWYGTTTSATNYQNDVALISSASNGFGYRIDDHGDTQTTATPLLADLLGAVSNAGVIMRLTDQDYFSFTTGTGIISLKADVAEPFNNLDVKLSLHDASGNLLAAAGDGTSFDAAITYAATAGQYRLVVASSGASDLSSASNYGFNLGLYTITGSIVPVSLTIPGTPASLSTLNPTASSIELVWTDNAFNESGFVVERYQDGGIWTSVATLAVDAVTWKDSGLAGNTSYSYRVKAFNADGPSAYSNTATATTAVPVAVPAAPSNLAASYKTKPTARVNLTWRDNSANETGFRVYRSTDNGITWSQISQVGANVTSYSDQSVVSKKTYHYRVLAFNTAGESAFSNEITITTSGKGGPSGAHAEGLSAWLPVGLGRVNRPTLDFLFSGWEPHGRHSPDLQAIGTPAPVPEIDAGFGSLTGPTPNLNSLPAQEFALELEINNLMAIRMTVATRRL